HPDDASRRKLRSGQRVRVFNDRGSFTAMVEISDRVRPGVAAAVKGHWPKLDGCGTNINATVDERDTDMGGGAVFHDHPFDIQLLPPPLSGHPVMINGYALCPPLAFVHRCDPCQSGIGGRQRPASKTLVRAPGPPGDRDRSKSWRLPATFVLSHLPITASCWNRLVCSGGRSGHTGPRTRLLSSKSPPRRRAGAGGCR